MKLVFFKVTVLVFIGNTLYYMLYNYIAYIDPWINDFLNDFIIKMISPCHDLRHFDIYFTAREIKLRKSS